LICYRSLAGRHGIRHVYPKFHSLVLDCLSLACDW
jgi:hypothetical protein